MLLLTDFLAYAAEEEPDELLDRLEACTSSNARSSVIGKLSSKQVRACLELAGANALTAREHTRDELEHELTVRAAPFFRSLCPQAPPLTPLSFPVGIISTARRSWIPSCSSLRCSLAFATIDGDLWRPNSFVDGVGRQLPRGHFPSRRQEVPSAFTSALFVLVIVGGAHANRFSAAATGVQGCAQRDVVTEESRGHTRYDEGFGVE